MDVSSLIIFVVVVVAVYATILSVVLYIKIDTVRTDLSIHDNLDDDIRRNIAKYFTTLNERITKLENNVD
jgi:hypothetical protein